ncbi:MAG: hypothetical protein OXE94_03730 [Aestuariivita sp.]|nr:hypothetical protein [Aestuariivita sp.]MCY4201636.1 hypothetical protein [Aestuariivita sp.]
MKAIRAENEAMESRIEASLAKLHEEAAKRDKDNLRWTVGLAIAFTTIILGAMTVMLTLTPPN